MKGSNANIEVRQGLGGGTVLQKREEITGPKISSRSERPLWTTPPMHRRKGRESRGKTRIKAFLFRGRAF